MSESSSPLHASAALEPAFVDQIGSLMAEAKDDVQDRVQALLDAFQTAYATAASFGNTTRIFFDDPTGPSCFLEPEEDVEPVRAALEDVLNQAFEPHGKFVAVEADDQHGIRTPYLGERFTFIANIEDVAPLEAELAEADAAAAPELAEGVGEAGAESPPAES